MTQKQISCVSCGEAMSKTSTQNIYSCSVCGTRMSFDIPKSAVASATQPEPPVQQQSSMPPRSRLSSLDNRMTFNEVGLQKNKHTPGGQRFHMVRSLPQQISNPSTTFNELENTEKEQKNDVPDDSESQNAGD